MIKKFLISYDKMGLPAKAAIWFTFCNIMQKGISMITVPIFTRILSTEEYGIFSIYLSWLNILVIFTSLNLYYGVFNNAMLKFENDRNRYISSMQGLIIVITFIFFLVYMLGKNFFNKVIGLSTVFVILMFMEVLVTPSLQLWSTKQRFDYKYKMLVTITLVKSLLNPIFGMIAIVITQQGAIARISSAVVLELIFCGSIMVYQFIKGKAFYVKKYWKYAVSFNLPLLPHYLSGTILNQADRIMIDSFCGKSNVAIYSVAYNIGMLIQLFTNAINASLTPWFYKSMKEKKYNEIRKVTNLLLLVMAIFIIILMFFAPEIVQIFATKEYYEAVYIIPPISASVFFIFMYILFSNLEFYFEENKFIMVASLLAAILNILLNYIFIKKYGYFAAGYTTLVSYIVYCFSHYFFCKIISKKHLGIICIYDQRFILILSSIIVLITLIFNFLYIYTLIRYSFLVLFFLVIFIKRKSLIQVLRIIK